MVEPSDEIRGTDQFVEDDSSSILDLRNLVVGITFSALFIYLAFRGVGFEEAISPERRIDPAFLAIGLFGILVSLCLRAVRWYGLLRLTGQFTIWELFQYNTLGWAMNFVLPLRGGEVIKASIAARRTDRTISFIMGTIGVLRIFDVGTLFVFLVGSVYFLNVRVSPLIIYLGLGAVILGVIVIGFTDRFSAGLHEKSILGSQFDGGLIAEKLRLLSEGLAIVRSPRQIIVMSFTSFFLWGVDGFAYYAILRSFGIELPYVDTLFVLSITSLGIMLPSTAGHIGNFEYFVTLALTTVGFDKAPSLSASIFLHATQYLAVAVFGGPFIIRYGADIWRLLKRVAGTIR